MHDALSVRPSQCLKLTLDSDGIDDHQRIFRQIGYHSLGLSADPATACATVEALPGILQGAAFLWGPRAKVRDK